MKRLTIVLALTALAMTAFGPADAQIGITDDCQADIKQLEDEIKNDRDDYTAESVAKARTELTVAKTNRLNPIKCRGNIQDARKALREGKRNKKNRDVD